MTTPEQPQQPVGDDDHADVITHSTDVVDPDEFPDADTDDGGA